MRTDQFDWISLAGLGILAGCLFLSQLAEPYLWQDEAQTAVIARTILTDGIPLGTDGRNFFSQEGGVEYADGHVWKWHTWLSFYAVAASFAALGATTFAARLPFALFGIATVLLGYWAARGLWQNRAAALASGGLLALSVPFLILSRQSRWYAMAAFFSLLGLHLYRRVGDDECRYSLALLAVASLLFHTHYLYVATLLLTLLVHSLWLERERFRRILIVSAAVSVVNAPWILWFASIRYTEAYGNALTSLPGMFHKAAHLAQDLVVYFLNPLFLLIPVALLLLRRYRGQALFVLAPETRSASALLVLFCLIGIVALGVLAPGAYFRYLTPLVPAALLLAGGLLAALAAESRVAAVALFAVAVALSPMRGFLHEIRHGFDGPIEGIVRFLERRAQPDDVVAITYGDMPLKFYTDLRVIGGLTGEDLAEAAGADWIILRHRTPQAASRRVQQALRAHLAAGDYVEYRLRFADTAFENREDPRRHRYRTAPLRHARVRVYGRADRAREVRNAAGEDGLDDTMRRRR
jgi:hypothetical protein